MQEERGRGSADGVCVWGGGGGGGGRCRDVGNKTVRHLAIVKWKTKNKTINNNHNSSSNNPSTAATTTTTITTTALHYHHHH